MDGLASHASGRPLGSGLSRLY